MNILFYTEGVHYLLRNKNHIRATIERMCKENGYSLGNVNYILCSKSVIKKINIRYLNHNYYTDIITFPLSEEPKVITADIFVSTSAYYEVVRVLFHGILHLIGYDDHTPEDQQSMRNAEEFWLSQFSLLLSTTAD